MLNIAVRLFACMQDLPQFASANDAASRACCVKAVLDEYHCHGAAATNSKYKMDRKMQNAISNVLTHVAPPAFRVMQRIYDKCPKNTLPFSRECVGSTNWFIGAVGGKKYVGIWGDVMKMTEAKQVQFGLLPPAKDPRNFREPLKTVSGTAKPDTTLEST